MTDKNVIAEIAAERRRQIEAEGWTLEHDDRHTQGVLALAGAAYAIGAFEPAAPRCPPRFWPFDRGWWKPKTPRRDLVRAAALIVAEIERYDRTTAVTGGGE